MNPWPVQCWQLGCFLAWSKWQRWWSREEWEGRGWGEEPGTGSRPCKLLPSQYHHCSLVPRLPQTLKLCRRGEPGTFSHVRSGKGRENLIVRGNLLHVPSYRALTNIHTEHWSIVGWTTHKTLPFCFGPILITSCLCRKDTRLSPQYIFAFRESYHHCTNLLYIKQT